VRELGWRVWDKQALSRVSTTQRTIIESSNDTSIVVARCDDYFPVKLAARQNLAKGQWCTVKISGIEGQSLLGECLA
jgi:tRNA A37 methylthiotransferase MiaB